MILNDWAHHHFSDKVLKKIYDEYIHAAGYMIGGNAATTLGGAALGGVIGSQVNK